MKTCAQTEGSPINIPVEAETIISILEAHGHEAYLVGGCVRDALLGRVPKDFDICTSALPEEILRLFEKTIPTGIRHGTVTVVMSNRFIEVTTFRIDAEYSDHRRPDEVIFSSSLTEDLKRRDFTINAIAFHPRKGVIDPFHGAHDLQKGIIRTVGDPKERFEEDALRMLRAVRFRARFGFSVDSHTLDAMTMMAETIRYVSRERILTEMTEILLSPYPEAAGILYETGLIQYILPFPFRQEPDLAFLKLLPEKKAIRWTAFFFAAGFREPAEHRNLCESLRMSTALKRDITTICGILREPLPKNGYMLRKTLSSVGIERFTDALALLQALEPTGILPVKTTDLLDRIIGEKHCISQADMAVNGYDLITAGYSEGKELGKLLDALFICILQKPELNRKDILMEIVREIKEGIGHASHCQPSSDDSIY